MNWDLLLTAACLAMLFEGIPFFMAPKQMKLSAARLSQMDESTLRIVGLLTMAAGVGLMVIFNT